MNSTLRSTMTSSRAADVPATCPCGQIHWSESDLRSVEYWRRLVAARLDLAVAALTAPDTLPRHAMPPSAPLPHDLSRLVGLPSCDLLAEAGTLEQLRDVLGELDSLRESLRSGVATTTDRGTDTLPSHSA